MKPIPSAITDSLRQLRRRITLWVLIDGLSRLLIGVIAFIALDLLLDWTFRMDRPQRAVMLLLAVVGLVIALYRRLWRPLASRPTDDALILEVEHQHPSLGESLISAVQFSRQKHPGVSPSMVRATIDRGVTAARNVEFSRVLDRRRLLVSGSLLVAAILILGGTAAAGLVSDTVSIWFNRNVLLGSREWPQDVHFQVVGVSDGKLRISRGDDWPLDVIVTDESRRLPSEAWMEIRGERRRQRLDSLDSGRRFQTQLSAVNQPFEFRIVESRASSEWIAVELVDRPTVDQLELVVSPPDYTGVAPESLAPGGGPYKILQGSRLAIRGQANKPLSAASLTFGKDQVPLTVVEGGKFQIDLPADQVRESDYSIDLLDTEQMLLSGQEVPGPLASREPATFRLRTTADREPQIQAKLNGIGAMVTARALIPIAGQITDDFGLSDAHLHHRWRGEKDQADTTGDKSLQSLLQLPAKDAALETLLDLESFSVPTGISMSFFVEAHDNNSVSGPGIGRSTVFVVRVVTDEEFRAALLAREREQGIDLEKRIKLQDELLTDGRALAASTAGRNELTADERNQLDRFRKRQKSIGDDLSRLARTFEGLVAEVRQNRIEDANGPVQTRLSDTIVKPLWEASSTGVETVIIPLEAASREAANEAVRSQQLAEAAAAQEKLLESMRNIASQLEQAEGFQDAINLLLDVQKAQEDVKQRTEKEKQKALEKLLNPGSSP